MAIDPAYRTPSGLTDAMRSALAKQSSAILATLNDDGSPHLTELLFDFDSEDRVLLPTPHNTRKVKNVRARPVASVFFFEQPGWTSCTGSVEIITGEEASRLNQRNRDRLLTPAGHRTVGLVLAAHEDVTLRITPTKWLSWSASALIPRIEELGGDVEADPPSTWFEDLSERTGF